MSNDYSTETRMNRPLLHAAIKMNTLLLAGVFGTTGGLMLFVMTLVSLNRGLPNPGHYLNLLGVFLPGYHVSPTGAWIGLFWGAVIGAVIGALLYRIYAVGIEKQVEEYLANGDQEKGILSSTLRINGNYLGLALGSIVALGLVVTTNWLVFRGTAETSIHAGLLVNYLPGYTVSTAGSLIGAAELFLIIYLMCLVFAWIYNGVATLRGGIPR